MTEIITYRCGYCACEFSNKSECQECENRHKMNFKIGAKKYLPSFYSRFYPRPEKIELEFEDGTTVEYRARRIIGDDK